MPRSPTLPERGKNTMSLGSRVPKASTVSGPSPARKVCGTPVPRRARDDAARADAVLLVAEQQRPGAVEDDEELLLGGVAVRRAAERARRDDEVAHAGARRPERVAEVAAHGDDVAAAGEVLGRHVVEGDDGRRAPRLGRGHLQRPGRLLGGERIGPVVGQPVRSVPPRPRARQPGHAGGRAAAEREHVEARAGAEDRVRLGLADDAGCSRPRAPRRRARPAS